MASQRMASLWRSTVVGAQNQHGQDAQHGKANQNCRPRCHQPGQNAAFVETHHGDKRKAFQSARAKDALAMVRGDVAQNMVVRSIWTKGG